MTTLKATAGPWTVGDFQECPMGLPVNGPLGRVAVMCPGVSAERSEMREIEYANARLISKAPEMMMLLKSWKAALENPQPSYVSKLVTALLEDTNQLLNEL